MGNGIGQYRVFDIGVERDDADAEIVLKSALGEHLRGDWDVTARNEQIEPAFSKQPFHRFPPIGVGDLKLAAKRVDGDIGDAFFFPDSLLDVGHQAFNIRGIGICVGLQLQDFLIEAGDLGGDFFLLVQQNTPFSGNGFADGLNAFAVLADEGKILLIILIVADRRKFKRCADAPRQSGFVAHHELPRGDSLLELVIGFLDFGLGFFQSVEDFIVIGIADFIGMLPCFHGKAPCLFALLGLGFDFRFFDGQSDLVCLDFFDGGLDLRIAIEDFIAKALLQ